MAAHHSYHLTTEERASEESNEPVLRSFHICHLQEERVLKSEYKDRDDVPVAEPSVSRSHGLCPPGLWSNPTFALAVVIVVCLVTRFASIGTYWSSDDFLWLKAARSWYLGHAGLFSHNPWGTFRPVTHLVWYVQYALFGDWAVGYRVVCLLFFLLNAIALFALIRRLSGSTVAAFLGALVFVTTLGTTVGIQVASYPIAGTLGVCCLILADRYASSGRLALLIGSGVLCVCALLAVEHAVVVPAALLLYGFMFARPKSARRFAAIVAVTVAFMALWGAAYWGFYHPHGHRIHNSGVLHVASLRIMPANFLSGLPLLVAPDVHSGPEIQNRFPKVMRLIDGLSWVLSAALAVGGILALAFGSSQVRLGVIWCLGGLLIGSFATFGFAPRYLYLPEVALALAVGPLLAAGMFGTSGWLRGTYRGGYCDADSAERRLE